jgi:pimeloyl-ACP methyl ester carboxylesterase
MLQHIDPAGHKKIICVGHDLGAVHAWNLSQCISHRLKALIVLNGLSVAQMVKRLKLPAQHLKSWYIYLMQVPYLPEIFLRNVPKLKGLPVPPINQYRAFVREAPEVFRRAHKKVQSPVLVVWGERDPFLMVPTLDEFTPYAFSPTVRIIEGRHWIHREKKDEVNQIVDRFLEEKAP